MSHASRIAHRLAPIGIVPLLFGLLSGSAMGQKAAETPAAIDTRRGDRMFADYFAARTKHLDGGVINQIATADQWNAQKDELRRQLHEMLGLDPLPERTPLNAVVTGTLDHPKFTVEKLHFQSSPQLYVTGSLYVPKGITKRVPAILYVCGHGNVRKDGISYGSKSVYQHHGAWFARHGFVCLIVDTLQLGEIEGLHHGVYSKEMFWWYSRGYTPAGVEVWNGMRAIDYLQSRKEVDPERIGLTGRSGGGAISWYLAACDERVKAAVPTAGITDLQNYVVDGKVEGHCDCMFQINTYGWDYGTVAALVAPRPLLISNTDDDRIFPLDGVERVHWQTKKIYGLLGKAKDLGLQISWGGHFDTQELQVAAFRWFNLHLKKEDPKIEVAATKLFTPEELKVFERNPEDQRNTTAHEWFLPAAKSQVPDDASHWATMRDGWMKQLREKSFHGEPDLVDKLEVEERRLRQFNPRQNSPWTDLMLTFCSDSTTRLTIAGTGFREGSVPKRILLRVGNMSAKDQAYANIAADGSATVDNVVFVASPRGFGDTMSNQDPKRPTHLRRRFMLLGQTLEEQQVRDVCRAVEAIHTVPELKDVPVTLVADATMAGIAVYAALFEPSVTRLELTNLPKSHMPSTSDAKDYGPPLLGVLKFMDLPQAVAMAAERATVVIHTDDADAWKYPIDVAKQLGWQHRVVIQAPAK